MKRYVALAILALVLPLGCAQQHHTVRLEGQTATQPAGSAATPRLSLFSVERPLQTTAVAPLKVHFIDMGQGDCTLIEFPNGKRALIDCGSKKPAQHASQTGQFIRSKLGDKKQIDLVVITHPHDDHYNMLPEALAGVSVRKLLVVEDEPESYSQRGCADWMEGLADKTQVICIDEPKAAIMSLPGFDSVTVQVLAANVFTDKNTNSRSIVLLISYGTIDLLLTGDATAATEKYILGRSKALLEERKIEVLKVGHHGSLSSTSKDWADAVAPKWAIVYCADPANRSFNHPRKEALTRLPTYAAKDCDDQ